MASVTVAVSLADKLDTLAAFYWADEQPTGSKDPFALRRSAIAIGRSIDTNSLRLPLLRAINRQIGLAFAQGIKRKAKDAAFESLDIVERVIAPDRQMDIIRMMTPAMVAAIGSNKAVEEARAKAEQATYSAVDFMIDRLKVQQREAGVRHDLIDAVFALGGEDDLVRLLARVKALQAFVETEEGANLLAGYRRAANILRAEAKKGTEAQPFTGFAYTPDAAEAKLAEALDAQLPLAETAIEAENFEGAMTALSVIRPAIDRFFDDVTVNSQDGTQRSTRLGLLEKLRAAMHKVADFSRIEG